jgi:hypothetical protein
VICAAYPSSLAQFQAHQDRAVALQEQRRLFQAQEFSHSLHERQDRDDLLRLATSLAECMRKLNEASSQDTGSTMEVETPPVVSADHPTDTDLAIPLATLDYLVERAVGPVVPADTLIRVVPQPTDDAPVAEPELVDMQYRFLDLRAAFAPAAPVEQVVVSVPLSSYYASKSRTLLPSTMTMPTVQDPPFQSLYNRTVQFIQTEHQPVPPAFATTQTGPDQRHALAAPPAPGATHSPVLSRRPRSISRWADHDSDNSEDDDQPRWTYAESLQRRFMLYQPHLDVDDDTVHAHAQRPKSAVAPMDVFGLSTQALSPKAVHLPLIRFRQHDIFKSKLSV